MKTADVIYKILDVLDNTLDEDRPDFTELTPESLGISNNRRSFILEIMQDEGLIKDVYFFFSDGSRAPAETSIECMKITLKGIMYLADNTTTSKVIKAAKLLKDTIPGL